MSAWTSDASALVVACASSVAVRSSRDIVEIDAIRGVGVELRIEKVVFQGVVPGIY